MIQEDDDEFDIPRRPFRRRAMSVSSRLSTASLSSTIRPLTATTPGATPAITPDFSPDSPLIMDKQVTILDRSNFVSHHILAHLSHGLNVSVCNPRMYMVHPSTIYFKSYLLNHLWNFNKLNGGSVAECLTQDRGAAGSSLTGITALWSLSKKHLS